jgi:hypothetical protein
MRHRLDRLSPCLFLFLLLLLGPSALQAQVTYLDSYYLQNKRLVHVQEPLEFSTYSYTSPVLNFRDFKAQHAEAAWLPDSLVVQPPFGDTDGGAWAISVLQTSTGDIHIPVLLFIADYDSLVSSVYADCNLNGDFNDDGPPFLLVPGRSPKPVDLTSNTGMVFRIHLQSVAASPAEAAEARSSLKVSLRTTPRWRLSLSGYFGVGRLSMDYRYQDGNEEKTVQYKGPHNMKGLTLTAEYVHGPFGMGLYGGFEHIFYWASTRQTTYSKYICATGTPCDWVEIKETIRGADRLPNLRMRVGAEFSWLPKVGKDMRLGLVASPGFLLSRNGYYQANQAEATRYRIGRQFVWEAGLQLNLNQALMLRATGFQSGFAPEGYFEGIGAQGLKTGQMGMRFSIGVLLAR